MAFPFKLIRNAPLASANIVEDMQLGYDLALAGASPLLAPEVHIWGELPDERHIAATQRTRWEHGHLQTLLHNVPRLLVGAFRQRRLELLILAMDLSIPPLALLVLIWAACGAIGVIFGIVGGDWLPAAISGAAGFLLFVGIGVAWAKFGRKIIPLHKLLAVPGYIAWKVPLYFKFLLQRQTAWVRTERKSLSR
jgi:cellulose synthase/poly-beta-1,6-N-acetylglucosamine synthase-like glycosyltransferase